MKYSLATNWDDNLLLALKDIKGCDSSRVAAVFGSLPSSIIGNARGIITKRAVAKEVYEKHIKLAKDLGFKFNYLLNSSDIPDLADKKVLKEVHDYLDWLSGLDIDIFTVADPGLLKFLERNYPRFRINISIVWGVKEIKQVNSLRIRFKNIRRFTLHQTVGRDMGKLMSHIRNAHKKTKSSSPVEIELLANEICLYNCPKMIAHYKAISGFSRAKKKDPSKINSFFDFCFAIRSGEPLELLNSPWIRPEDVGLYEKAGLDYIKLSGREEQTSFLLRVADAYLNKRYNGNFLDLTVPSCWKENRPFMDNRKLDGILNNLWRQKKSKFHAIPDGYQDFLAHY